MFTLALTHSPLHDMYTIALTPLHAHTRTPLHAYTRTHSHTHARTPTHTQKLLIYVKYCGHLLYWGKYRIIFENYVYEDIFDSPKNTKTCSKYYFFTIITLLYIFVYFYINNNKLINMFIEEKFHFNNNNYILLWERNFISTIYFIFIYF